LEINRCEVVDIDAPTRTLRGTTWFNIYSPKTAEYDLSLGPSPLGGGNSQNPLPRGEGRVRAAFVNRPETALSWLGLPGAAIGGMETPAASAPTFDEPYLCSRSEDSAQLENTPLAIGASMSFIGQWGTKAGELPAADLRHTADFVLAGTIENTLEIELTDAVLLYDRWAYILGDVRPGARLQIERDFDPRTIDTWLTRRKIVGDKDQTTPYDRADADVSRILQLMMFHESVGGRRYTGLLNRVHDRLDLSNHLTLRRAILLFRGPNASKLSINKAEVEATDSPTTTFYRCVLPVRRE
jgi:hypothetical protein